MCIYVYGTGDTLIQTHLHSFFSSFFTTDVIKWIHTCNLLRSFSNNKRRKKQKTKKTKTSNKL